jgi:uncharacterized SAM-binding protein YcdF (DUF218 family)
MNWLVAAALAALAAFSARWLWRRRTHRTPAWWAASAVPVLAALALAWFALKGPGAQDGAGGLPVGKFLALLVMPTGLIWLALAAAAIVLTRRRKPWAAGGAWLVFLLYTLAGNVWVGWWLLASLEDQVPEAQPAVVDALPPVDIVCVLSGGTLYDRTGLAEVGESGDRVFHAAALYTQGRTRYLGCSGTINPPSERDRRSLVEETSSLWRSIGIPDTAIVKVPGSPWITATEVEVIRDECQRRGFTRVGILTSGWHLPRTLAHCRRLGFTVIPIAADRVGPNPDAEAIYLIPQGTGFRLVQLGLWERLGRLLGR